jgi:serine/threonine-protein kinase HipA
MNIAAQLGIEVPPHGLFPLADATWAYIVRRFDRTPASEKRRCEDFAQILEEEKYSGSHERLGKRLKEISRFPGLDAQFFYERVLLSFLLGNGDAHLKNYSMLEDDDGFLRLSPAYDMVCSRLLIPREVECALSINGKKNRIRREDFEILADILGIPSRARTHTVARLETTRSVARNDIPDSHLPADDQELMLEIIEDRWNRIYE